MTARPTAISVKATLTEAMQVMEADGIRHLPVVEGRELVGVISERDLLSLTGWMHERERAVLEAPEGRVGRFMSWPVVTVAPDDSLIRAVLRLVSSGIGCLPVVRAGDLVGLLSEIDVLRGWQEGWRAGELDATSDRLLVRYMTPAVISVQAGQQASEALELMHERRIRHLPVLSDGALVGILSDRDLRLAIGRGEIEGLEVRALMTPHPFALRPGDELSRAVEAMIEGHFSSVPLLSENGELEGILTVTDLLGACLEGLLAG